MLGMMEQHGLIDMEEITKISEMDKGGIRFAKIRNISFRLHSLYYILS